MFRRDERMIQIKTEAEIALMRAAGLVVGRTLDTVRAAVAPGVTTAELDAIAEESIRRAGAVPSFKGYHGFPASICASVNDEIVHGIPGPRILREGDIIAIDCGAIVDGYHGDAAVTVPVGSAPEELLELIRVCEDAMWQGLAAVQRRRQALRHRARDRDLDHVARRLRHRPGVHRARDRHRDAPGAERAQLRPARARPPAAEGPRPGRGAHGQPGQPAHPPAGRRLDRGHG